MFSSIARIFDSNDKEVKRLSAVVSEINSLEDEVKKLKDESFSKETKELKDRASDGEPLDLLLPEAFALSREAARRTIGQRPFDVQLMAAVTLAQGKITEQKTGEGKTLSAVSALYLHSLTGKNVHLVTVNDYLARRDCGWMGPVFSLLGLTVSSIINDASFIYDPNFENKDVHDFRLLRLRPVSRKEAYEADIVYGINSEFGFDYLRDNMASSVDGIVQRGHYYAVVDEVDSVLIDEARTPHIISAPDEVPTQKYYEYAGIVDKLSSDTDYKIDEKLRTAHLTDHGIEKIEKLYGISNIYEKDFDTVYHLEAALKARTLFHKEKDYIVKDGQVILVDEFTGRLMEGRRLSEGLHQAIEAKEGVAIQRESKTLATVSLQNYFRMYERLAGMTGTAVTESQEFHKIYGLDVIVVPTNMPTGRKDNSDAIYKTGRAKLSAVANEIEKAYKKGQPVLVGTTSIDKNEVLSELLKRRGIKHEVLNAKNHEREAEIIAKAGEKGSVTVATNMAGRGVDIVLGGDAPKNEDGSDMRGTSEWEKWEKKHKEVVESGGLFVIGTERHESRRIDNQLRGRSGRQGDPGESRFFVSLDDEIMRLFGGDKISGIMTRFNMPEDVPLEHPLVSKAIEQAQVISVNSIEAEGDTNQRIADEFVTIIPFNDESKKQLVKQLSGQKTSEGKIEFLSGIAESIYKKREEDLGEEIMRQIDRFVMLSVIDTFWTDHLDAIDNLRQGIGLRGYGQKDPLVEYKNEAFGMFEKLIAAIDDDIAHKVFKIQVAQSPHEHTHEHEHAAGSEEIKEASVSEISSASVGPVSSGDLPSGNGKKKLGRNDPCWCGSGKKWKKCHYPEVSA
ncbi:MAG: Protein translocase subunit SecA [Candidatus Levybacteria bacterium GW2011_GWB1_41_21]|nr:MAG: Protein translocase subunit SecA [Candidatus Levybacteria bacterium GW2011_GWB1_41_21]